MSDNIFLNLNQLNSSQLKQYEIAVSKAFPSVISESAVIKTNWPLLEKYFPEYQFFLISNEGDLIGFMNTVPFHFNKSEAELPEDGWDWMLSNGIEVFQNKQLPNFLGGLQVIVRSKYQNLGYSKIILKHAKQFLKTSALTKLLIPIRPTKKHEFPKMSMFDYLDLKQQNEVYDPWIRTNLKSGAQIIKICEKSMTIKGDVEFWENLFNKRIETSGNYLLQGALSPISINVDKNFGQYIEPNIWIKYKK